MFILSYYFSADFPFFVYIYICFLCIYTYIRITNNITFQDSPDGPVVSTALPLQGVQT